MTRNHIYLFSIVIFPLLVSFFFADLMKDGLPTDMPVGIVDLDNSSTSRKMARSLDAFQEVKIIEGYHSVDAARKAMQRGEIYGYFLFPEKMNDDLLANRQPTVSFYYNSGYLIAGSLVYKDMRTIATLGSAAVGAAKLSMLGKTDREIKNTIQPIMVSSVMVHNPTMDYNVYLSTTLIPTCLGIFIFLVTAYSIGTELKFGKSKQWLQEANGNIYVAMLGKMLPQTLLFMIITSLYIIWLFGVLQFPHSCPIWLLLLNGLIFVVAAQGFGIFIFGIIPSLRMSMSICALWSVVSFSICGFTFPVEAMDAPLRMVSWLFPVRHYFMIYQMVSLNGYPLIYAWPHYIALLVFALLPFFVLPKIKNAMLHYVYIP
ncbi:MAG: ABC transporter permease [Prevotella sp.]|nr:ABC transporter permease [Prevotella sp.]